MKKVLLRDIHSNLVHVVVDRLHPPRTNCGRIFLSHYTITEKAPTCLVCLVHK